jgi:hypothetical protein
MLTWVTAADKPGMFTGPPIARKELVSLIQVKCDVLRPAFV